MKLIHILTAVILVSTSACEKEIAYDGEELKNYLVCNSIIQTDSVFECMVTRSKTIFEKEGIARISDAVVEVYQNEQLIETLPHTKNGYYRSGTTKAIEGSTYTFKVSHPSFKTITGSATTLAAPKIELLNYKKSEMHSGYEATISIENMEGNNYFRIKGYALKETSRSNYGPQTFAYFHAFISSDDPLLNFNKPKNDDSEFDDQVPNRFNIFNDDVFDGKYQLKFDIGDYQGDALGYKIEVQHITEDLYLYYNTLQSRQYLGDDDALSEPIKVHCNVSNGAGIIGGVTSDKVEFIIANTNLE
ncbi:MAG: DUF4249 domain-containing protein [Carboxylicivirga sp.]|jgi:hypothetical protein|nr:DUF4249 domain-containing protein [Carboxylicivirga sp.]